MSEKNTSAVSCGKNLFLTPLSVASFPSAGSLLERMLVFWQSAILCVLLLNAAEAVSAIASGNELVFLAALAFPLFAFATGLLTKKKSLFFGSPGPDLWLNFAFFFLLFPIAFLCSLPAEYMAGKTGWNSNFSTLFLFVLCLVLFWNCACLFRRMRDSSPPDRGNSFSLSALLGAACGCYLYFFRTAPTPVIVLPLLSVQILFLFIFAPPPRMRKFSALQLGVYVVWHLLVLYAGVCLGISLLFTAQKITFPCPEAGGVPLNVRIGKDSFLLFRGGMPVDKRSVSRYSDPGGRLSVLAVLLQNYCGKPLKTAMLVSPFSPLPFQLDAFRSMIAKNTVILSPYSPSVLCTEAFRNIKAQNTVFHRDSTVNAAFAAGCDTVFIDLPKPHHFGSKFFFTLEFLTSLRKGLNPGGLLVLRVPRTGDPALDHQCETALRTTVSALTTDSVSLSGKEGSCFLIPGEDQPEGPAPELTLDSLELGSRLKRFAPQTVTDRFLTPLTVVFPILEKMQSAGSCGGNRECEVVNTVEKPLLFAVFPKKVLRSAVFFFFVRYGTLLLLLLSAAYFLCRYFIDWSPLHKPCFRAFETGFFMTGLPSLFWFRGQLYGAGLDFRRFALDWSLFFFLLTAVFLFRRPTRRFLSGAILFLLLVFLIFPFSFPAGEIRAGVFFMLPAFAVASMLIRFDFERAAPSATPARGFAFLTGNGILGGACAFLCAAVMFFSAGNRTGFPLYAGLLLLVALPHLPFPFREGHPD